MKKYNIPHPLGKITSVASLSLLAVLPLASLQAQTTTLLDDKFTSATRPTQDLPNSSAWYFSKASSYVSYQQGKLTAVTDNTTQGGTSNLLTYFTAAGAPVSLQVGQQLSLNFSFQLEKGAPNTSNNLFRIGIYDSGGSRITADGLGSTNTTYQNYKGYMVRMPLQELNGLSSQKTPLQLFSRDNANNTLTSAGAYTAVGDSQGSWENSSFADNTDYFGNLVITRSDSESITISLQLTGSGLGDNFAGSWTISNGYTTFDTFALMTGNENILKSLSVTGLEVTLSNIPESSSIAIALGIGALALCASVKRWRR